MSDDTSTADNNNDGMYNHDDNKTVKNEYTKATLILITVFIIYVL